MSRKAGANNNDQNFIKRCIKEEVSWDVSRIAAHLLIEEPVVQHFYDLFVKELENESSTSVSEEEEEDIDPGEEFDTAP